jgi:predicted nucleic acid-binding protein
VGAIVLDASVIIAFLYEPDAQHEVARTILTPWLASDDRPLIPASVYSEILVGALRTGTQHIVDRFVERTESHIVPIDRPIGRRAAELRAVHRGLRLPDALVLAVAHQYSATLLTLDRRMQWIFEGGSLQ